ncbi:hypothetical protein DH2020_039507 [Rehmannia glutinosa]|uniref:Uncharacterized protein n=1 Tax=Rehmannia glutinosa TaxID=99300 RepID=A0ABR0UXC5_REHGL
MMSPHQWRRPSLRAGPAKNNELLSWNCRGLGNPRTVQELRELIRDKSPLLVFLCETKLSAQDFKKFRNSLGFFGVCVPANGRSGGLGFLWRRNIDVTLRGFNDRFIDVNVNFHGKSFRATGVYGQPEDIRQALLRVRPRVTTEMANCLTAPYTAAEITRAVKQMHPYKSPESPTDLQAAGKIHGIRINRHAPSISHLFFANDTLLFGNGTIAEAQHLRFAIDLFERASGQRINHDKSGVLFSPNTNPGLARHISNILGISIVDSHGKYLGLPSIIGKNKRDVFSCLQDRVWKRIVGWKEKSLSQAGRDILVKTVIQAIPTYAMSCFRIPDSILEKIQSMASNYFWSGSGDGKKIHWLSWKKIAQKKDFGGLGFRHLRAFNLALLAKQAWRLVTRPASLLARLLRAKYFPSGDFFNAQLGSRPSWSWRSILESRPIISVGARRLIRSGTTTRIWLDPWLPRSGNFFAHPLGPINNLSATVSSLIDIEHSSLEGDIIRTLFNRIGVPYSIHAYWCLSPDLWCWHPNKNGKFSVKSAYHTILTSCSQLFDIHTSTPSSSSPNPVWKKIWSLQVPPRFKLFAWRCSSEALSTVDLLAKHHIFSSDLFPFCSSAEGVNHIFFYCHFAKMVWNCSGLSEVVLQFSQSSFSSWYQDVVLHSPPEVRNLFVVLSCLIWYHRNKRKFEGAPLDPISVVMAANNIMHEFCHAVCTPDMLSANLPQSMQPSPLNYFPRVCFDGAISTQARCCGIGVAVFDAQGIFVEGFSKKVTGIVDPEIAECLALKEALHLAEKLNIGPISIFGDAAQVVLAANDQVVGSAASSGILQDIFSLKKLVHIKGIFLVSQVL